MLLVWGPGVPEVKGPTGGKQGGKPQTRQKGRGGAGEIKFYEPPGFYVFGTNGTS